MSRRRLCFRFGAGLVLPLTLAAGLMAGCSDDTSGTSALALSSDTWQLPDDVRAAGEKAHVSYSDVDGDCKGSMTEGAKVLGDALMAKYGVITSVGGYACRANTANASKLSIHAMGRALDIMIPEQGGGADSENGDPIANYLVKHADLIGIQLIIWNHTLWHADGRNEKPYGGPNPHTDHIHAEINEEAANKGTQFFQNPVVEDGPGSATPTGSFPSASAPLPDFSGARSLPSVPPPRPSNSAPGDSADDPTKPIEIPYDGGASAVDAAPPVTKTSVPASYADDPAAGDPKDSIGAGVRPSKPKAKAPPPMASGCATAPGQSNVPSAALVGLALAAALVRRRRHH